MNKKLSRRDFLKLAALAGGAAFLQACRLASFAAQTAETPQPGIAPTERATGAGENSATPEVEVAIVGAGIAGLTAAYLLKNKNMRVLEANPKPGGRTLSGKRGAFSYAKGTEYLGPLEGILAKMARELGVQAVEIPEPMDAFFRAGRMHVGWVEMTRSTVAESGLANYNQFMRAMQNAAEEYEDVPDFSARNPLAWMDDDTAEDWFDQIGAADIFYERYNVAARGLFGANLDEISALCAVPEFGYDYADEEPLESMDDIAYDPGETPRSWAYTFAGGISDLTDAIAAALGDKLELNAPVRRISPDESGYFIEYANGKTLWAERVILAIPAPLAISVASDALNARQRELLAQVDFAPYITCALFSNTPLFDKAFDLALPDGRFLTDLYDSTWVQRRLNPDLKFEKTYIASAYIAAQTYRDKNLLQLSNEEVVERVVSDLQDVVPGIRGKVQGYDIQRFPHAYPVLTPGAYARMLDLHRENNRPGALLLAGDYMIYPTFEAAAETGLLAAEHV
jgi:protoporphyrinogen oxidase